MAKSKQSFDRLQRERAKKAKADAKRERRLAKDDEATTDEADTAAPQGSAPSQDAVLKELEELHAAYDDERINFDDFEAKRAELLSRLQVD
jgi:hypothetical protein